MLLTLTPYRGNHTRYFPAAGCLGATDVIIQGRLKTSLEEDALPLIASSVIVRVRCYESTSRGGKVNVLCEVSKTLWSSGTERKELGDWTDEFRLVIPKVNSGVSTMTVSKHYRAWWQIEAIINHEHILMQGRRQIVSRQIPLINHAIPSSPSLPIESHSYNHSALQCQVNSTTSTFGPSDPLNLHFQLRKLDPHLVIKKIEVSLLRHIQFSEASPSSSSLQMESDGSHDETKLCLRRSMELDHEMELEEDRSNDRPRNIHLHHFAGFNSPPSQSTNRSRATSRSPKDSSSTKTSTVLEIISEEVLFENGPTSSFVVSGIIPARKSNYLYSIGESVSTKLVNISFTILVKIHIKSKNNSVLCLAPLPTFLTSTTAAESTAALSQYPHLFAIADMERRLVNSSMSFLPTSPASPRLREKRRVSRDFGRPSTSSGVAFSSRRRTDEGAELFRSRSDDATSPPLSSPIPHHNVTLPASSHISSTSATTHHSKTPDRRSSRRSLRSSTPRTSRIFSCDDMTKSSRVDSISCRCYSHMESGDTTLVDVGDACERETIPRTPSATLNSSGSSSPQSFSSKDTPTFIGSSRLEPVPSTSSDTGSIKLFSLSFPPLRLRRLSLCQSPESPLSIVESTQIDRRKSSGGLVKINWFRSKSESTELGGSGAAAKRWGFFKK